MGRVGLVFVAGLLGGCSNASLNTFNAQPKAEIVSDGDIGDVRSRQT
jgi:hypothetical protein